MKSVDPGLMDCRITLYMPSHVADSYGDEQPQYNSVGSVWAKIEPISGREYWQAQQAKSLITHKVTIWYAPYGKQLRDDWRFTFESRTFNIAGHRTLGEAREFIELMAIEAT